MKKDGEGRLKAGLARALLPALAVSLVFLACEKKDAVSRNADGKELFKLRCVTQTTFSETIIADRLGFFADEGIELEYVGSLGQGVSQYQAVEQGYIDVFTQGHPSAVAQARLAGLRITQVAPGFIDDPDNPHIMYLVREDSPLKTLDDIPGHKVAMGGTFSPCTNGYLMYYLSSKGLDPDSIEFVVMAQPGSAEQALVLGKIDITTSHTPYGGVALAGGGVRVLATTWDIFHSPGAGLAARGFSDAFIEAHPDIVQGFVNATYRARVFMHENPAYSRIVGAEYLGLDPSEVSSNSFDQHKNITPEYVEEWFVIAEQIGLWNKGDILPEDVYTNRFVPRDVPASDAEIGKEYRL
jgi:ABC-type nitrate/sulfonate/bicarbonate transport system substrate-binding protein